LVGILIYSLLKSYCGCNNIVEGQGTDDDCKSCFTRALTPLGLTLCVGGKKCSNSTCTICEGLTGTQKELCNTKFSTIKKDNSCSGASTPGAKPPEVDKSCSNYSESNNVECPRGYKVESSKNCSGTKCADTDFTKAGPCCELVNNNCSNYFENAPHHVVCPSGYTVESSKNCSGTTCADTDFTTAGPCCANTDGGAKSCDKHKCSDPWRKKPHASSIIGEMSDENCCDKIVPCRQVIGKYNDVYGAYNEKGQLDCKQKPNSTFKFGSKVPLDEDSMTLEGEPGLLPTSPDFQSHCCTHENPLEIEEERAEYYRQRSKIYQQCNCKEIAGCSNDGGCDPLVFEPCVALHDACTSSGDPSGLKWP
jgi:hypothetical protein